MTTHKCSLLFKSGNSPKFFPPNWPKFSKAQKTCLSSAPISKARDYSPEWIWTWMGCAYAGLFWVAFIPKSIIIRIYSSLFQNVYFSSLEQTRAFLDSSACVFRNTVYLLGHFLHEFSRTCGHFEIGCLEVVAFVVRFGSQLQPGNLSG